MHIPTVFISYAQENPAHIKWVSDLASRLRKDGIDARIDQWQLQLGQELTQFMEESIRENDFVLIICTPKYKEKSDNRQGGVGYEGTIITSELFQNKNKNKFIPILKDGTWESAVPSGLGTRFGVDISREYTYETQYCKLKANIKGEQYDSIPPIENKKEVSQKRISTNSKAIRHEDYVVKKYVDRDAIGIENYEDIKINGIVKGEVTLPKMDGSAGSALYKIPFRLSKTPSVFWSQAFVAFWDKPAKFTTMHRPHIARVVGDKIILDGTTMEEVVQYHQDTLKWAVQQANEIEKGYIHHQAEMQRQKKEQELNHRQIVDKLATQVNFDD